MAFPFIPVAAGLGIIYGLSKLFFGGSKSGGGGEPKPEPGPGPTPPDGTPPLVKISPDIPEGTVADFNEGYSRGRLAVDQAIHDEAKAAEDGETYCESMGCVGNINHLSSAKASIKTNQGRKGYDAGVDSRLKELGLTIDENGDIGP